MKRKTIPILLALCVCLSFFAGNSVAGSDGGVYSTPAAGTEFPWEVAPILTYSKETTLSFKEGSAVIAGYWLTKLIDRSGGTVKEAGAEISSGKYVYSMSYGVGRYYDVEQSMPVLFFGDGGTIPLPDVQYAGPMTNDGLIAVEMKSDKRWGFIDRSGEFVIEPVFAFAGFFAEGLARVQPEKGGNWGYIDKTGELVIPALYPEATDFSEGLAAVKTDEGLWGYINKAGEFHIKPQFTSASPYTNGRVWVTYNGQTGLFTQFDDGIFIPIENELKWSPAHVVDDPVDAVTPLFSEGFALVKQNGLFGLVDFAGNFVIPPVFTKLTQVREGLVAGERDGRAGLFDTTGDEIFTWDSADPGYPSEVRAPSEGLVLAKGRLKANAEESYGYFKSPLANPSEGFVGDWERAMEEGIIPSQLNYYFDRGITRLEFCELLARTLERAAWETLSKDPFPVFTDTYNVSVHKLQGAGIVGGIGNTHFSPDELITREQAAKILIGCAAYLGFDIPDAQPLYADSAQISQWALPYAAAAEELSLLGARGGEFRPLENLTREEAIGSALALYLLK